MNSTATFALGGTCRLVVEVGDLTRSRVDAIVNAANASLLGGGGVDGAIHRAAGPELVAACKVIPQATPGVRCPTGEARITPGFLLPTRWIIHTAGPVYRNAVESAPLLREAHRNSLLLAREHGLKSVAFPAISCGVYGYPIADAAPLALETCREHAGDLEEVRFVLFGDEAFGVWSQAARKLFA
jgi:O-acetyl-ADP-ribose deacetylase (regulator of RNase III)